MTQTIRKALIFSSCWIALLWAIHITNLFTGYQLNSWGILPRHLNGLSGIIFSPFLHGSFIHLISNSVPLFVLAALTYIGHKSRLHWVIIIGLAIGGLGTWLFGSASYHIGASGLVFAFWGYLIAYAWFKGDIKSILVASITLFLYGGLLFSLLSVQLNVSFSSHLFGFLAGVVAAYVLSRNHSSTN